MPRHNPEEYPTGTDVSDILDRHQQPFNPMSRDELMQQHDHIETFHRISNDVPEDRE